MMTDKTSLACDVSEDLVDEVFKLLRKKGPLSRTQISVDLLIPYKKVETALQTLRVRGVVEQRSDYDKSSQFEPSTSPWGLATSFHRDKTAKQ